MSAISLRTPLWGVTCCFPRLLSASPENPGGSVPAFTSWGQHEGRFQEKREVPGRGRARDRERRAGRLWEDHPDGREGDLPGDQAAHRAGERAGCRLVSAVR